MRAILCAGAGVLAVLIGTAATAAPAIVYSIGTKFDGSFNQSAAAGVARYEEETGEDMAEFEPDSPAEFEQALRRFAREGRSPVIAVGFLQADALAKVSAEMPEGRFAILDMVVDVPNVQSIVFREHEGAYVVGRMAALKSETGTLGFVGGMDIPLIRRFACGYLQGARSADPDVEVLVTMTGDTPAAWADSARGAEIARSQIDRGADIVMQAAGATGLGVLQAAAEAGKLGIGTDSNQNGLHPGQVFTSVLKRLDIAVYDLAMAARRGDWSPGLTSLGLKEGGIAFAVDANNQPLITEEIARAGADAMAEIVAGTVRVHDLYTEGPCPLQ